MLGVAGVELIAEGLAHNGSLLSLDLSDNKVSSVGAIELAEALHGDNCKVAELLLANNKIGRPYTQCWQHNAA